MKKSQMRKRSRKKRSLPPDRCACVCSLLAVRVFLFGAHTALQGRKARNPWPSWLEELFLYNKTARRHFLTNHRSILKSKAPAGLDLNKARSGLCQGCGFAALFVESPRLLGGRAAPLHGRSSQPLVVMRGELRFPPAPPLPLRGVFLRKRLGRFFLSLRGSGRGVARGAGAPLHGSLSQPLAAMRKELVPPCAPLAAARGFFKETASPQGLLAWQLKSTQVTSDSGFCRLYALVDQLGPWRTAGELGVFGAPGATSFFTHFLGRRRCWTPTVPLASGWASLRSAAKSARATRSLSFVTCSATTNSRARLSRSETKGSVL